MNRGGRNRAREKSWPGQDAADVHAEKHGAVVQKEERSALSTRLGSPQSENAGSSPASAAITLDPPPSEAARKYRQRAASGITTLDPTVFKHSRYGGMWLDTRSHWSGDDVMRLSAACDMGIPTDSAANYFGRAPTNLVHKAIALGIYVPREWRSLIRSYQATRLNLEYPYIIQPDKRHDDLIAVNRMVSRAIPGREDVCQDIMLALLENRTSLADLRADPTALRLFINSFRRASFERSGYGVESMDVTLHSDDGDGKSKHEDLNYQNALADPDDEYLEDIQDRKILGRGRSTRNFSDRAIAALSKEEETIGVPAAFWARAEM